MSPHGRRVNPLTRIRERLWSLHVFNTGLLDCAQCGKRVAAIHEMIRREEADGVALCRSCFELILKNAVQTPEYGQVEHDSPDLHGAEVHFPEGSMTQGRGE